MGNVKMEKPVKPVLAIVEAPAPTVVMVDPHEGTQTIFPLPPLHKIVIIIDATEETGNVIRPLVRQPVELVSHFYPNKIVNASYIVIVRIM